MKKYIFFSSEKQTDFVLYLSMFDKVLTILRYLYILTWSFGLKQDCDILTILSDGVLLINTLNFGMEFF